MPEPLLDAHDVTVRFGGLVAVDHVGLELARGEVVGMIGPNGAGKTTTFGALWGLVPLADGRVHLDGHDITGWRPARRARAGMARTFQRLELFGSMTVLERTRWASGPGGCSAGAGTRTRRGWPTSSTCSGSRRCSTASSQTCRSVSTAWSSSPVPW